jgi:cbb3-type cytochrome oxidase maturation protein
MNIVLVMLGLSVILLLAAAAFFFWAVDHGQFDDMDTPGLLPLDDDPPHDTSAAGELRE